MKKELFKNRLFKSGSLLNNDAPSLRFSVDEKHLKIADFQKL